MNTPPSFTDNHQFPDIPSDFCIHMFLEGDIIRVGTGNTANLTIYKRLLYFCCEFFGPVDGIPDLFPGLHIIMKLKDINIICQFYHSVDKSHTYCYRSRGIKLMECL